MVANDENNKYLTLVRNCARRNGDIAFLVMGLTDKADLVYKEYKLQMAVRKLKVGLVTPKEVIEYIVTGKNTED